MYTLFIVLKKNLSMKTSAIQYEELVKYMDLHFEFAANKYLIKKEKTQL